MTSEPQTPTLDQALLEAHVNPHTAMAVFAHERVSENDFSIRRKMKKGEHPEAIVAIFKQITYLQAAISHLSDASEYIREQQEPTFDALDAEPDASDDKETRSVV